MEVGNDPGQTTLCSYDLFVIVINFHLPRVLPWAYIHRQVQREWATVSDHPRSSNKSSYSTSNPTLYNNIQA